ncbi:MAG: hypothetical protein ACYS7Y_31880, partial [Planctomycetota bacterium]
GCEGYDPYYSPERPAGPFRTVMCNFVLNVIEGDEERRGVLASIDDLLAEKSYAYITVRTSRAACKGETRIGTWQGLITLDLPIVHRGSGYVTYIMGKGESDCNMKAEVAGE